MDGGRSSHVVWSSADPAPFLSQNEGGIKAEFKQRLTAETPDRFKYVIDVRC
jgi:hypothetical protein